MQIFSDRTTICAARHYIAAHESACTGEPVDFGAVCRDCKELTKCHGNWMETAVPLFDAADIRPTFVRTADFQQF